MYREIRSERLSVKVNAARIRQAASWPSHAETERGRGRGERNEKYIYIERERGREERDDESDVARTTKREAKGAVGA